MTHLPPGVTVEPYRFVYDCGSDTGPLKPKQTKPLHWAIEHFAENDDPASKHKITVNSLYLSHFQKDHIDGAKRLAELVNLKEIVIPHLARDQLVHLLAQQIASGQLTELTTTTRDYLDFLDRAAGDGSPLGDIPTTRVAPGGEPPGGDNLSDADRGQSSLDNLPQGTYTLDHSQGTGTTWTHARSRLLGANNQKSRGRVSNDLWELRVWSYAQGQPLTDAVVAALNGLTDNKGNPALPNTVAGKVDLNELAWAIENRTAVQKAYQSALTAEGVTFASDHNVVSLCLHSGPTRDSELHWNPIWPNELQLLQILVGRSAAGSWLGTGDALLAHPKVWSDFHSHFSQGGMDRTHQWRTVFDAPPWLGIGWKLHSKLLVGPVCNACLFRRCLQYVPASCSTRLGGSGRYGSCKRGASRNTVALDLFEQLTFLAQIGAMHHLRGLTARIVRSQYGAAINYKKKI